MWECFIDKSYYDKWALREIGNRHFFEAIHVDTEEEARFLTKSLNELTLLKQVAEIPSKNSLRSIEISDLISALVLISNNNKSPLKVLCYNGNGEIGPADPIDFDIDTHLVITHV